MRKDTMRKDTIKLSTKKGKFYCSTKGYNYNDIFGVHRPVGVKAWQVTHIPTGLRMPWSFFRRFEDAKYAVYEIAEKTNLINWKEKRKTYLIKEINKNPGTKDLIILIMKRNNGKGSPL